jgi:hypothetical protein
MGAEVPVFLANGPAMWLRLMPSSATGKTWPYHELRSKALSGTFDLRAFSDGQGMFGIRAEDGFGMCPSYLENGTITTTLAFVFESGEVWSVDTDYLRYGQTIPFIEEIFVARLQGYVRFLQSLGIQPPYKWSCGMVGVKGYRLYVPVPNGHYRLGPGPLCLKDTIQKSGTVDGDESAQSALYPFFREIFDRCGVPRPNHLPR